METVAVGIHRFQWAGHFQSVEVVLGARIDSEELLQLIRPDAEALGCIEEVERTREILIRGTSAHRQIKTYDETKAAGASDRDALNAVVDMLIEETTRGL